MKDAWHWHVLSRNLRPGAGEFQRMVQEKGVKAAIKWRDQHFRDEGFDI
jgi:hypothetical protein